MMNLFMFLMKIRKLFRYMNKRRIALIILSAIILAGLIALAVKFPSIIEYVRGTTTTTTASRKEISSENRIFR